MDLFETLQKRLGCEHISDLPFLWRTRQSSVAFAVLRLDSNRFDLSQWIDLCDYLQVPYTESDIIGVSKVRALFMKYA